MIRGSRRLCVAELSFGESAINQNREIDSHSGKKLAAKQVEGRSLLLHVTCGAAVSYRGLDCKLACMWIVWITIYSHVKSHNFEQNPTQSTVFIYCSAMKT